MKKILLFTVACISTTWLSAQFIYKIKADSVLITNDSCIAELNLENRTRDTLGFLYNKGNGRTEFRRGLKKVNDSTYVIGNDTLRVVSSLGKLIVENGLTKTGDTVRLGGDLTASTSINMKDKRIRFYLSDNTYTPASNAGVTITGAKTAYNGNDMLYIQAFNRPASTFSGAAVFTEVFWQPTGTVSSGTFTSYISSQKSSNPDIDMNGLTLYDFRTIFFTTTNQKIGNRYHYFVGGSIGADPIMTNHVGLYVQSLKRSTIANAYAIYSEGAADTIYNAGPVRWTKYKNNSNEDSVLTTDINGIVKLKALGSSSNFIQNQNATDQAASFRISGNGIIKGGISSPVGPNNERFGFGALASVTTGQGNTAVGYNALNALNGSDFGHTAVGYQALGLLTTSTSGQTAIGSGAMSNFTSGSGSNTAIGYGALQGSTGASGYSNVAVGYNTLTNISSGFQNIAVGTFTSSAVTTGQQNVNIGGGGLSATASYNVGVGSGSLGNTSGTFNVGLGQQALYTLTSGSSNIGIGYGAGGGLTTGSNNIGIGYEAGVSNNGSNNTFIGHQAGYYNTGSGNVFLGRWAGINETGSNKLFIDNSDISTPLIYGDFANDTVRVNGKFHANGPVKIDLGSDATGDIFYRNSSGAFTRLGIGTSGQVLTVNGSNLPSWAAGGGGGGGLLTADNGLTANSSTNVRLGGTLLQNTVISSGGYTFGVTGSTSNILFTVNQLQSGYDAINGISISQAGVKGTSTSGYGVAGISSSNLGGYFASTSSLGLDVYTNNSSGLPSAQFTTGEGNGNSNTVLQNLIIRRVTAGTPGNGIGSSIDFDTRTVTSNDYSNRLISKWTDATHATRTSQFIITGVNSGTTADRFTLSGNGALKLNNYGSGTFTGTAAYTLQVDASGNIIEGSVGGGGGSGYTTVQENGTGLTQRSTLNFNYGVTATDNSGASKTDVNVDLTNSESFMTSDVTLTANTYSDAVSFSLAAGTWLITGSVTVESPNNTAQRVTHKLWDGTTVYQAGESVSNSMGGSTKGYVCLPVSSLVVLTGTTTVKVSVASTAASVIKATPGDNNSGTTNKATSIRAVRIK